VVGLMNVQFAIKGSAVFVLEVNPRASRTVPFVSKAIGVPLAKLGAKVMAGKTLVELGFTREIVTSHVAVKESVFPFTKFPGVDTILGPEMRSTGEVMGLSTGLPGAFLKAQLAAGSKLPSEGRVFVSVRDDDKQAACEIARRLSEFGYQVVATGGTQEALARAEPVLAEGGLSFEGGILAEEPFEIALRVLEQAALGKRPGPGLQHPKNLGLAFHTHPFVVEGRVARVICYLSHRIRVFPGYVGHLIHHCDLVSERSRLAKD